MSDAAFNFKTLDPEKILDVLWDTGIRVDSGLTALNSYENRVWQFSDEDKRRYVAKFYRPQRWTELQLLEEHQFTVELDADDVPVAAPLVLQGKTLHQSGGFWFAVFPSLGGRQYETDNYDQLEAVGRCLGRLHQTGKKALFSHRPTLGLTEYFTEPREIIAGSSLIPSAVKDNLLVVLDKLGSTLRQLWHHNWQSLRLHGDCHPGNILWRDGPFFVDLDDARNGPAVQDLWMLVNGDLQEQRIQWDILLEAYSEFSDFDVNELILIEPLRAMRMVYYLSWILKRWQDPAFPLAFPWITDEDFWRRQVVIFSEQEKILHQPIQPLSPQF
ncbi:serine/threonine protein kinase [Tatumella citrea]|uniref:Stress response kinase A n=1 Tax=Tatumella citrea TaxID=53336 RepID=A0A1Y0LCL7_TATCI|nr:serine/threonine protein kinase [Tatumella citrea]ARU95824.1 stress response serine/threonine protein kinase YihE [Tatumella citrea]ARU99864.1 stress response serine/threonine protein kinase YihE [Tatumella citrea]